MIFRQPMTGENEKRRTIVTTNAKNPGSEQRDALASVEVSAAARQATQSAGLMLNQREGKNTGQFD